MPVEPGKTFIDTNILIYLAYDTNNGPDIARVLLQIPDLVVSTQVLNEFCNISLKKLGVSLDKIKSYMKGFANAYSVSPINYQTTLKALDVKERYRYSFYDSLIIASALQNDCTTLLSEDMQDGQLIYREVKIMNPLKVT